MRSAPDVYKRQIFERVRKLGSARQVLLSLAADGVHFPRPSDGKKMVSFDWTPIRYRKRSGADLGTCLLYTSRCV